MRRYSVLVIDDNRTWCAEMEEELLRYPCFKIEPSLHDGKAAIDFITINRPDILVLDLIMPEFDGLYVIDIIRDLTSYLPFIYVVSAIGSEKTNRILKKVDVDYYSVRPVRAKAVARNLHRLIVGDNESDFIDIDLMTDLDVVSDELLAELGAPMYLVSTKTTSSVIQYCITHRIDTTACSLSQLYNDVVRDALPNATAQSLERNTRSTIGKMKEAITPLFLKLFPNAEQRLTNGEFYYTLEGEIRSRMKDRSNNDKIFINQNRPRDF